MSISERIRQRRLELGLTLEQVGSRAGISKATVQRYECGNIQNMRQDKIQKLADALEVTPAWLMDWTEQNAAAQDIEDVNQLFARPELRALLLLANDFSREEIEQLIKTLKLFREHRKLTE
ncbi:MAG: helix-turn-helix domain-containing protein [Butyricicoccaceae bacterium]